MNCVLRDLVICQWEIWKKFLMCRALDIQMLKLLFKFLPIDMNQTSQFLREHATKNMVLSIDWYRYVLCQILKHLTNNILYNVGLILSIFPYRWCEHWYWQFWYHKWLTGKDIDYDVFNLVERSCKFYAF